MRLLVFGNQFESTCTFEATCLMVDRPRIHLHSDSYYCCSLLHVVHTPSCHGILLCTRHHITQQSLRCRVHSATKDEAVLSKNIPTTLLMMHTAKTVDARFIGPTGTYRNLCIASNYEVRKRWS